eukprot:TRINITY_DN8684_c0_g1_i1.p1 TRINITY_DN8684_c0_g1~~TRINITY_DN8684_c0_g1_i1.p1  ORF type:complete len:436 (-),score=166.51 TRINITY_DN8684_c0_g1_i1:28-1296(-)
MDPTHQHQHQPAGPGGHDPHAAHSAPAGGAPIAISNSGTVEIRAPPKLVNYQPTPVSAIPTPLPPATSLLPWEKRALADQRRDESRKKNLNNSNKKKGFLSSVTKAVTLVATAASDAFNVVVEDFKDSQSPGANERFHKYFPGFPLEKAFAEYRATMDCGNNTAILGMFYITNRYFAFYGEQFNQYILFMLPLSMIRSIQRGFSTKLPPGSPPMLPKTVTLVEGGAHVIPSPVAQHPAPTAVDPSAPHPAPAPHHVHYPKLESLLIFTEDNMKHVFTGVKHSEECYNVLDHAWRNPNPSTIPMNGNVSTALQGSYYYAQAYGTTHEPLIQTYGSSAGPDHAHPPAAPLPASFFQPVPHHDPLYPHDSLAVSHSHHPPSSSSSAPPPSDFQQPQQGPLQSSYSPLPIDQLSLQTPPPSSHHHQ